MCDKASGHTVNVSREGFPDAVVWNPWIDKAKATADFSDEEYQVTSLSAGSSQSYCAHKELCQGSAPDAPLSVTVEVRELSNAQLSLVEPVMTRCPGLSATHPDTAGPVYAGDGMRRGGSSSIWSN